MSDSMTRLTDKSQPNGAQQNEYGRANLHANTGVVDPEPDGCYDF
jgi:hypothetical protein